MIRTMIVARGTRTALVAVVFATGWLCGALTQRSAQAQIGQELMNKAAESGGPLGAAAKLGTSISDIQTHLDALQKNVDTLKSIKSALGG
jgi:hypothetical protein